MSIAIALLIQVAATATSTPKVDLTCDGTATVGNSAGNPASHIFHINPTTDDFQGKDDGLVPNKGKALLTEQKILLIPVTSLKVAEFTFLIDRETGKYFESMRDLQSGSSVIVEEGTCQKFISKSL